MAVLGRRFAAAVEPEIDPNAKIKTWLDQSGEHLRKSGGGRDAMEEDAAVTFQSLSMVEEEEVEEEEGERGERSKRPEENGDEEMSEC